MYEYRNKTYIPIYLHSYIPDFSRPVEFAYQGTHDRTDKSNGKERDKNVDTV